MKQRPDKPARQRTPRWIIVLCIAIVVVPIFYLLYRNALDNRVKAKLEAIRRAGYPATLVELNDWYVEPPPGENGADLFMEAFSQYVEPAEQADKLPFFSEFELPPGHEPLSDETKKQIAAFLAENQGTIALLQQAVDIKHCRYPLDFTGGIAFVLPTDLSAARLAAWLLGLKALLHAENNEPDLAAESIHLALGVAHSFANEPVLISQLVRRLCQEGTVQSIERVLHRTQLTDQQLAELALALAAAEDIQAIQRALAGNLCLISDAFTRPEQIEGMIPSLSSKPSQEALFLFYIVSGLLEKDHLFFLDLMSDYVTAVGLPLHERLAAARVVEDRMHDLPWYHMLTRSIFSASYRTIQEDLKTIARLRTARTALAVQRYRLANAKLPETLSQLVPTYLDALPEDPFDGHPLRYRKLAKGYVVYSVGHDGKDDGGKEVDKQRDPDVAFTIEQ